MTARILSLGDTAFTVEFAAGFDDAARRAVASLDAAIARARAGGDLVGVVDTAPTFRSLTVHYDPLVVARAELEPAVAALIERGDGDRRTTGRAWRLPVTYGGDGGPDLEPLARACGLSPAEVVDLHAGPAFEVYMLGFLPGFAFMGDIDERLRQPRLAEPRVRVPAGAVGVADRLTAIYPWESPGGWHLIGTCPVPLFDARRDPPALLAPADRITFEAADSARTDELAAAFRAGTLDPAEFRVSR